jgi:glycosyltransferase involved in cell wall biosynthesis
MNKPIIFITQYLVSIGGVVRVITNWSNYFIKTREVENVSIKSGKPYFDLDKKVKWTIIDFKFRYKIFKLIDIIPNTIKMYKFLKQRKNTNIVFNKSLYIEPIWILRKFGLFKNINLIYMHHGGSSGFRTFFLSRKGTAHRVKIIFNSFDKVVCLFDDEENFPPQVKKEKLYFVENPLSFGLSDVTLEQKENIVLSLGRVTKAKGIDTLIYAWERIKNDVRDWKLQIVGDGKDKEKFIKLVEKLDMQNIEFIKGTTDIKPLYKKAKIFVIPSIAEGMPMTIMEAMACKCCVISTKTGGGKKLIDNSKTGLLFDIGDSEELSKQIINLIKDKQKREELATNALEYVKRYEIENIANKWDGILV